MTLPPIIKTPTVFKVSLSDYLFSVEIKQNVRSAKALLFGSPYLHTIGLSMVQALKLDLCFK